MCGMFGESELTGSRLIVLAFLLLVFLAILGAVKSFEIARYFYDHLHWVE